jgi:PKD repeat protein
MPAHQSVTATFTSATTFTLSVSNAGSGSGTVTSSPAGINCGTNCSAAYNSGTVVNLTATPASGSTFTGWSGACTGTAACSVTMSADQSVTATFKSAPSNQPPTCSPTVSPTSGQLPLAVNVVANCTDPENDIASTLISFGDGFYQSGTNVTHTYVTAGTFQVTVVATDTSNASSSPATQSVTVTPDPSLFVGITSGLINRYTRAGGSSGSLSTGQGGSMTGMAFDMFGNLYSTDFTADTVSKFTAGTALAGTFGNSYNCKPESIAFDNTGHAYVGQTGCSHALLKFDAYGNLMASFPATTEQQGTDWIDLAADQCTLFYTSQGTTVFRFNVCSGQQMPPFATGLHTALAVRVLPDKSVLVADKQDIVRLDSAGRTIHTYDAPGEDCWVDLTLDSDGSSFWAADYCTSDIVHFDINSGDQIFKFNTGTPANSVFGLITRRVAAQPIPAGSLVASPTQATSPAGQSASFTLALNPSGGAVGQTFKFFCADLPRGANCSFSPTQVTPGGSGSSVTLTISTTAGSASLLLPAPASAVMAASASIASSSASSPPSPSSLRPAAPPYRYLPLYALSLPLLGIVFLPSAFLGDFSLRKKFLTSRLLAVSAIVTILLLTVMLVACGGSSSSSSNNNGGGGGGGTGGAPLGTNTPAGTYTVIVNAVSGSFRSSTSIQLTVQ